MKREDVEKCIKRELDKKAKLAGKGVLSVQAFDKKDEKILDETIKLKSETKKV